MGSQAYGVATTTSDVDVYGVCIPPKEMLFPHLKGEIEGFGRNKVRFEQYQQHHITYGDKQNDVVIYNITKYFTLAMECNPNIIDSLFVPQDCVLFTTSVGQMIRDDRKLFLSKEAYKKFRGYALSQKSKVYSNKSTNSKRAVDVAKHGVDTKFLYHIYRLLSECEQILECGNIDLRSDVNAMRIIREGGWGVDEMEHYFALTEERLVDLYETTSLPAAPREVEIKQLLMDCLETHYGSLSACVSTGVAVHVWLNEIEEKVNLIRRIHAS